MTESRGRACVWVSAFVCSFAGMAMAAGLFFVHAQAQPPRPERAAPSPAYSRPPAFPVAAILFIDADDGVLSVEREFEMPGSPIGLEYLDIFAVEKVAWSTQRQRFLLTLARFKVAGQARRALEAIQHPGDRWQDVIWFPKESPRKKE